MKCLPSWSAHGVLAVHGTHAAAAAFIYTLHMLPGCLYVSILL